MLKSNAVVGAQECPCHILFTGGVDCGNCQDYRTDCIYDIECDYGHRRADAGGKEPGAWFFPSCISTTMQEGKNQGLGSLSGTSIDSYWGKNKGRSMEGMLVKITRVLLFLFLAISAVLNIGSFQ